MSYRAGFAVRDLFPGQPMPLFGYPHVKRISTGVHDPVLASALYLDNGKNSVVLIALDILFLNPPAARAVRRTVADRLQVPESHVFISCTHTHSAPLSAIILAWRGDIGAPDPDPAYLEFISTRTVEAVVAAKAAAEPADFAWTKADALGVGGNRITPGGLTDPVCGVLAVRAHLGERLLGLAVIYGMHPTVIHEDTPLVSSDFPHYTRQQLREDFGKDVIVLYHTAPCGNQSPRHFVQAQTFAEAERLGRMLGRQVSAAVRQLVPGDFHGRGLLLGVLDEVQLPRRPLSSLRDAEAHLAKTVAEFERLKAVGAERALVRTAECAVFGAEGGVVLARQQAAADVQEFLKAYDRMEVQSLRIGNACLVGLPGEVFTDYALEIKGQAKMPCFPVSLVNGDLQGYIVIPAESGSGGYEAETSLFAPAAGALLVKTALKQVNELA